MEPNSLSDPNPPDLSVSGKLHDLAAGVRSRISEHHSSYSEVNRLMLGYIENGIRIGWMLHDAKQILKGSSELFGDWCEREIPLSNNSLHQMMKISSIFKRDYEDLQRRLKSCLETEETESWQDTPSLMDQIQECRCGTFREILVVNGLMPARKISAESGSTVQTGLTRLWSFFVTSQTRMQKIMRIVGEDVTQWNEADRVATRHKLRPYVELDMALAAMDRPKQSSLPANSDYPMQQTLNRFGR